MNPSSSQSRILDALLAGDVTMDGSYGTPMRTPLQNSNTPPAEPGGSNLRKRARTVELARKVQERLMSQSDAIADASFLSSSLSSSPMAAGGFGLNYDSETPIRAIDVGGHDQEEKMADFVTKSIENLSDGLTVKDAMGELGLKSQKDLLPGLEVRLLPHQAIGVAWMLKREQSSEKGGILADDMGTREDRPDDRHDGDEPPRSRRRRADDTYRRPRCTSPAGARACALYWMVFDVLQWKEEIETKTNEMFSVRLHHGKDKLKKASEVKEYDVVITTYQTLCMDFQIPKDVDVADEAQYLAKYGGVLARSRFYRAIADEAQYIRNRGTKASLSLAHVRAKYRWMLTGTPVTNTLADIYGLLRFGRFRPWNDWNSFNEHVPLLLRRTKNSTLEGKPILSLPPKDIELVKLQFSDEEREIYDLFEKRSKIRLNRFIRAGTLVKNHAAVLVMILRLRQLCCHPHLILSIAEGQGFGDPTLVMGSDADKERGRAQKLMGKPWVDAILRRFLIRASAAELLDDEDEANAESANCPVCRDLILGEHGRVLPCGHEICFDCTLDLSNSAIAHDGIFGEGNEKQNLAAEKEYEEAAAKGPKTLPDLPQDDGPQVHEEHVRSKREAKRPKYNKWDDVKVRAKPEIAFEDRRIDSDSDDDMPAAPMLGALLKKQEVGVGKGKARSPQKRKAGDEEDEVEMPSDAVISNWGRGDDDLEPSTKMLAMMQLLKEWEATGDKVIVYSQWTSMLDLIEILFSRHGIRNLRFDGKMDRAQRDSVLATFKRAGGPKVILISTKCGSVGLNLVAANRIINMDLSWNAAAETQAYDRAHRIGQNKNVWVKRLVVENTIEERMLKLQDVKSGLADAALGEGTGGSLHKMSVKDIKQLFGMAPSPNDR
ncbi:SNF2 family DNA-dependent ATPase [Mycena sanguinolenta]|uniref:SNF2 family DNA-dependent ATPase n=1 Tax=Mycena sanguinolenta TaxID=230812 RepID=A0A8H6Z922_9AGAR|nr:SNF2 family DNA-dependent ATPase [Mycena sanguinolenta]